MPRTAEEGREVCLDFQNENLVCKEKDGLVLATVPDIITLVDATSGRAYVTEEVKFGLKVAVMGFPCHEMLATPTALAVVGPAAFGYTDLAYRRLPGYRPPVSHFTHRT